MYSHHYVFFITNHANFEQYNLKAQLHIHNLQKVMYIHLTTKNIGMLKIKIKVKQKIVS